MTTTKCKVDISKDGVWAGTGKIDEYGSIECTAVICDGTDTDDCTIGCDEIYTEIEDAIASGDTEGVTTNGYDWYVEDEE